MYLPEARKSRRTHFALAGVGAMVQVAERSVAYAFTE